MERLVQTWMASGREEEIDSTVQLINDQTDLLNVVKSLGEYLTSGEGALRSKGVEFLSLVLAKVHEDKVNRQSARVLVTFYCNKLDDADTIKPALTGLLCLAKLPSFSPVEATATLEAIFSRVRMKALVQSVRFIVFSIVDTLMASHRQALKAMGKAFLDGYVGLAEGEKDPRNLMVAFAIARVILIEFDVSQHVEAFFNITYCYFPISFRPPPNDPYGIATDDLRLVLRRCLSATPLFGPLAIPVFLEKLTAGSRPTKKDTLQTLAACLPVYGPALARSSARKLWNSLKLEIFQPMDVATEEEALKTTQTLINTIYSAEEEALESNDDVQGLARDACKECLNILKEPEKSQARPATKILCSFISTTPSVARYTISQAIPHLVNLFLNPDETSTRPATLTLLSEFLDAARKSSEVSSGVPTPPLLPFKDSVLGIYTVGLKTANTRSPAISGLKSMVRSKGLLTEQELGFVVHNLNEIIEGSPEEFENSSDEILDLLVTIGEVAPQHVADQTLPLLFRSLPDSAPARDDTANRGRVWKVLAALQTLCVQPDLFENLVIRLTTKLELLCFPNSEAVVQDLEPTTGYAHALLRTLGQTLAVKVEKKHPDVAKYADRLVPRIYNVFIYSALNWDKMAVIAVDHRLILAAAEIITLITQSISEQRQKSLAAALVKTLAEGDPNAISHGIFKFPENERLWILKQPSSDASRNLLPLVTAAVVALGKSSQLQIGNTEEFLDELLTWVVTVTENDLQRLAALHIVAAIVNRQAPELSNFLQKKLDADWNNEVMNKDQPLQRRLWAIKAWVWIAKALAVQKHPLTAKFSERLYEAFTDSSVAWEAARALGQIASHDSILTKANHAEIKVLYSQKYAQIVLPHLIDSAASNADTTARTASLVALTSVIKSLPQAMYAANMPALMPLLLRGLQLPDAEIRNDVIETLLATAGEGMSNEIVAQHATSLAQSMLMNSKVSETPSVKVRCAALKYLAMLPSIVPYATLHPQRAHVLRELAVALDDPKRVVRKEAVLARTNWFKYKG